MSTPVTGPVKMENPEPGTRLDSWKEVASYLRRGERTVKRWETDRGLPIHRVPGGGRGSVYAYTSELESWLKAIPADGKELEEIPAIDTQLELDSTIDSAAPGSTPVLSAFKSPLPRNWMIATAALALLGVAGASVILATTHRSNYWMNKPISPSSAQRQQTSDIKSSGFVSDSEKRLAHDLYLKGRYEWGQRTPDSLNRALDDFTQAIVHDPNNAKVYVGLADTYNLLQIYSTLPPTDSYPRAMAAARRAVALDDSLAEAHRALAFTEFYGAGEWRDSEAEFRRAIELDPKDAVTRRWYANAFALPGRYDESLAQFDKALELDPASHSTLSDEGKVLYDAGRQEEGIALLKSVEQTNPEFFSPHLYLMEIALIQRDYRTFLNEGKKAAAVRHDPVLEDIIAFARAGYASGGERGFLNNLYAKQEEYYAQGKYPTGLLAKTCVALGKRQEALRLLAVAYSRHTPDALWCLTEPDLRTLRDEPQYKDLVRKINFPAADSKSQGDAHASIASPVTALK